MAKKHISTKITDTIVKNFDSFVDSTLKELESDGHLSKKDLQNMMKDGRIILELDDRYMLITISDNKKKREREMNFQMICKMK
jgi:hypothetical protein